MSPAPSHFEYSQPAIPGIDMTFDEGGAASGSRINPVNQYNMDKQRKFFVHFYVLCNNSPRKYSILHCDMYQSKNSKNNGITEEIFNLPTAQQVALFNKSLGKSQMVFVGFLWITDMPLLLFLSCYEKNDILCAATTQVDWIGWLKDLMANMKSELRGTSKRTYDKQNAILYFQWMDSKVIYLKHLLETPGDTSVSQRSGSNVLQLTVNKHEELTKKE